ncbi:MAG TPA: acetate/propionate family kinase [Acidothermaceae bacterium]|jgi:acetate kinase
MDSDVLIVNAGSSSLKVRLLNADDELRASWDSVPDELPDVRLVAHRVVHGGAQFQDACVIDAAVLDDLRALTPLAPLHQPKSLEAYEEFAKRLPNATHVACFDTAFHATIPAPANTYAIPREWNELYGIRRYGFHGLSHAWASRLAHEHAPDARRVVTCHLGAGASLCAVLDGVSIDTTMGFTPLEGLVMATRSGDIDPGLINWLSEREVDVPQALEERSGLTGLAGTGDMRVLLDRTDDAARLAIAVYIHRLRKGIAAMAASLGGIDICVFTGGVGENAASIRLDAAAGLGFLGIDIDAEANAAARGDAALTDISSDGAAARTLVIAAREDREMARQARKSMAR